LFVETKRFDEALNLAGALAKDALASNDFVLFWCARLVLVEIALTTDKLEDADCILNELGETNAFLQFCSLRSEVRRRQGNFDEAVKFAADSITAGEGGPRYNYGEEPLRLRYALALRARGDAEAAKNVIVEARDDLRACAGKMPEPAIRDAYLKNIGTHARTMALAQEWAG
jgi:hypothetical protein